MRKTKLFITFLAFYAIWASFSQAQMYDRAYLENFAKRQLASSLSTSDDKKVSIHVTPIDPRVRIKPCQSELSANIPQNHNGRNVNIEISCDDSTPWSLYIPSRVSIMAPIVVALSAIDKGSRLTSDNIGIRYVDEKRIRGEKIADPSGILGAKSKRTLSSGSTITRRNICVVCKGDSVTIEAVSDVLNIKTSGIAQSNGYIGDKIRVKNERSGKLVSARISGLNTVEIKL
jgi:flagellar basal body P-ring formation protein FlgA